MDWAATLGLAFRRLGMATRTDLVTEIEALRHKLAEIRRLADVIEPHVACDCDFMEQGTHLGCPRFLTSKISTLAMTKREVKEAKEVRYGRS